MPVKRQIKFRDNTMPVIQFQVNVIAARQISCVRAGHSFRVLFGRVRQRFMGKPRLLVPGTIPERGNDGDGALREEGGSIHKVACRRDRECCKQVDLIEVVKQFAKQHRREMCTSERQSVTVSCLKANT